MKIKLIAAVAISALLGLGVASAAVPNSSTGVITGCYTTYGGSLRIIDKQAGASCNYGEIELPWNQAGPAGAQGPQGETGPQGEAGADGAGASFELIEVQGWDASQTQYGLWTRTVYCPAGKTAIAAYGSASSASSYGGLGYDTLALSVDSGGPSATFGVVKISGMPPYVLYGLHVTCANVS